ncbi:MAG: cupin domain-containing protein [Eubacteriales bacterium]|nr:cupin domain-containing protein [Eubacteriales bacterium]MDD4326861.1 cupin domain-containing protein [Eubacteriales bacterium]MDD4716605.1 cupin domain-containing protein [Eubacteriales bacterium]
MNEKIQDIADRIKGMRDVLEIHEKEMADLLDISVDEYLSYENAQRDFTFTFLYKVANRFGIDMTDLLTGRSPKLAEYTIVRSGEGLPIERRKGFTYQSLSYNFKDRIAETFLVTAKYDGAAAEGEILMSTHRGQEFDHVIKGSMRFVVDGHETVLNEGDCVYYNSGLRHGMTAVGGDCIFLAVVMNGRRS